MIQLKLATVKDAVECYKHGKVMRYFSSQNTDTGDGILEIIYIN